MKNQGFYDCLEEMLISSILVRVTRGDIAHLTSHISHLGGSVSFPMDVSGWQEALLHLVIQRSRSAESSTSLITSDGE